MAVRAVPDGDGLGDRPQRVGDHRLEGAVGHELFDLGEGTNRDARDSLGEFARELRVNLGVTLAVVADEEPPHVREHARQAAQFAAFVLGARAEPPGVRRAKVRHEEAARRVAGALQE